MTKLCRLLLATLMGATLIVMPITASARKKDFPNSGFCKSGKHVKNLKKCKEYGGKK